MIQKFHRRLPTLVMLFAFGTMLFAWSPLQAMPASAAVEDPALVRVKTENTELCWFAINQLVSTIAVSHQAFEEQTDDFATYLQFRPLLAKHLERALTACHDVRDNSVIMPVLTKYRREFVSSTGYFHILRPTN